MAPQQGEQQRQKLLETRMVICLEQDRFLAVRPKMAEAEQEASEEEASELPLAWALADVVVVSGRGLEIEIREPALRPLHTMLPAVLLQAVATWAAATRPRDPT